MRYFKFKEIWPSGRKMQNKIFQISHRWRKKYCLDALNLKELIQFLNKQIYKNVLTKVWSQPYLIIKIMKDHLLGDLHWQKLYVRTNVARNFLKDLIRFKYFQKQNLRRKSSYLSKWTDFSVYFKKIDRNGFKVLRDG